MVRCTSKASVSIFRVPRTSKQYNTLVKSTSDQQSLWYKIWTPIVGVLYMYSHHWIVRNVYGPWMVHRWVCRVLIRRISWYFFSDWVNSCVVRNIFGPYTAALHILPCSLHTQLLFFVPQIAYIILSHVMFPYLGLLFFAPLIAYIILLFPDRFSILVHRTLYFVVCLHNSFFIWSR